MHRFKSLALRLLSGTVLFLTAFNIIKFELYAYLNPSFAQQYCESLCISSVHSRPTVCKAKPVNIILKIQKVFDSIESQSGPVTVAIPYRRHIRCMQMSKISTHLRECNLFIPIRI